VPPSLLHGPEESEAAGGGVGTSVGGEDAAVDFELLARRGHGCCSIYLDLVI
jgi:hypothetical protein